MKCSINIIMLLMFFIMFALGGCGRENKDQNSIIETQNQISQGKYRAILRPINNKLSGFLPLGYSEIQVDEEEFKVKIQMQDLAPSSHPQAILQGKRCPNLKDDKNNDGIIDLNEALIASGKIILFLDENLSPTENNSQTFPRGRNYTYFEKTPLLELEDHAKKKIGENLNLHGRVILIHGSESGQMMPVSCGILQREILSSEE